MITFRNINYDRDIPEITALMHLGLSKKNNPDSFYWKHVLNPFGRSFGLLALENEKIIGARMFMFWEFKCEETIYKAIRPVDTIIHPSYRGKGIFKDLTLKGLEDCRGKYDLIFNTPNNNSYPGYLRMGWQEMKHSNFFKISFVFSFSSNDNIRSINLEKDDLSFLGFPQTNITTHINQEYLKWRYSDRQYNVISIMIKSNEILVIYKIDIVKGIKFVIISEIWGDEKFYSKAIKSLAHYLNVYFIFYLSNILPNSNFAFTLKRNKPLIVFKDDDTNIIDKIQFSAGDLEGRL